MTLNMKAPGISLSGRRKKEALIPAVLTLAVITLLSGPQTAELMQNFGCSEAVNLDGGGSSTLVIGNEVVNRPSDPTGPRPVANALVVVQTGPAYDH